MNGLDSNGLTIYASETTSIAGYEHRKDMNIDGIVEANLAWWDSDAHRGYLFFGDGNISRYALHLPQEEYRILDRQTDTVLESVPTFEHLLCQALRDHRPNI